MRVLPRFSTVLVALVIAAQSQALILCGLLYLFTWGRARCGWGWGIGGGGGGGTPQPPPPPPITCMAGTMLHGTGCIPIIGVCRNAPQTEVFAHPTRPCGCGAPGDAPPSPPDGRTVCSKIAIENSRSYCENFSGGGITQSKCVIECNVGYKMSSGKCLPSELKNCPAGKEVASGPKNAGCICLPKGKGPSKDGFPCGDVVPTDGTSDPRGRMICKLNGDKGDSVCEQDCDDGYEKLGTLGCTLKT